MKTLLIFSLLFPLFGLLRAGEIKTLRFEGQNGSNWTGTVWREVIDGSISGDFIPWIDGSDAEIPEGASVRVQNTDGTVTARNLSGFDGDGDPPRITVNGTGVLELTGQVTGAAEVEIDIGHNTPPSPTRRGMLFSGLVQSVPQDFRFTPGNFNRTSVVTVADGSEVTFHGSYSITQTGAAYFYLQGSGKLVLSELARLNNNQTDLINAQPFRVIGDGTGEATVEMQADFNTDWADPNVRSTERDWSFPESPTYPFDPNGYIKPVGGLSTLRVAESIRLISHHTRNLPSIHKYTGSNMYTHHGLLNFDYGPQPPVNIPIWTTKTNPQEYDGGIYFTRDWVLETDTDMTFIGIWHEGVNIGFATRQTQNLTLYKRGLADFILAGTQAYAEGTRFVVEEGAIRFQTNPDIQHWPEAIQKNGWFYDDENGNELILEVEESGGVSFEPAPASTDRYWLETKTFDIHSGDIAGTLQLHLNPGRAEASDPVLAVANTLAFQPGATFAVLFDEGFDPNPDTEYLLLQANTLDLTHWQEVTWIDPTGWEVELRSLDNEIWLVPASEVEFNYETWADALPEGQRDPLDILWDDAITNLARYAHGLGIGETDEPEPGDFPVITASGGTVQLQFRRVPRPDVHYALQYTDDLRGPDPEWTTVENPSWSVVEDENGRESVTIVPPALPPGVSLRIYRIRIALIE